MSGNSAAWSAGVAVELAGAVAQHAVLVDERPILAIDLLPLPQPFAGRAHIAVVLVVEGEGRTLEGVGAAGRMIDYGDVWLDAALLDQP